MRVCPLKGREHVRDAGPRPSDEQDGVPISERRAMETSIEMRSQRRVQPLDPDPDPSHDDLGKPAIGTIRGDSRRANNRPFSEWMGLSCGKGMGESKGQGAGKGWTKRRGKTGQASQPMAAAGQLVRGESLKRWNYLEASTNLDNVRKCKRDSGAT